MGEILKMRPADLIRKANRSEKIERKFTITVSGEPVELLLTAPDIFDVLKEQERCIQKEYAECSAQGMDKMPINEADWINELSKITESETRKALTADKPMNLAQQVARKNARLDTVRVLLPKKLKLADGTLAFPSLDDQKEFGEYVASHSDVMNIITKEYVEIMNQLNEVNKQAKNSLSGTVGTNTVSK
jgi:hypothetical protein